MSGQTFSSLNPTHGPCCQSLQVSHWIMKPGASSSVCVCGWWEERRGVGGDQRRVQRASQQPKDSIITTGIGHGGRSHGMFALSPLLTIVAAHTTRHSLITITVPVRIFGRVNFVVETIIVLLWTLAELGG